jgi:acyl-CoA thioester hydrolase
MPGLVNKSVYQNALEPARHAYLKTVGIDFKAFTERGINLVVVRAELDYKSPLQSGERFTVGLTMVRESPLKFAFYQDILRLPEMKPVVKAKIIGTALNGRGRPQIPAELEALMQPGA